jgi:hypothetical protein
MYDGPGIYRHYKGGHYRVLGVARHESNGSKMVIYHSYSVEHDLDRWMDGADWVARPLNAEDVRAEDRDPFNEPVRIGSESQAPRFTKVSA